MPLLSGGVLSPPYPGLVEGSFGKLEMENLSNLGADPFIGMGSPFFLPRDLRDYLEDFGISSLAQARNQTSFSTGYWFSSEDLDLTGEWKKVWDNFIRGLEYGRIRLSDQQDTLLWSFNKYVGSITASVGYECILSAKCFEQ